jgi:tetratricopeptide (TPR) repeat protein
LTLAACVAAQEDTSETQAVKALLREAHQLSESAEKLEEFTRIIDLCEQTQQSGIDPKLNAYANQLAAWAYNRRGEWYADRGATQARNDQLAEAQKSDALALEQFETAIQKKPDYWKAIHNRGVSRALNHNFEEAVKDFTRVTQLMPTYPNAWFNLGEIRFELGQFDKAVEDYSETLRHTPNDADVYIRRGLAYSRVRRHREALADFSRAVDLAPENPEALTGRGDAYRHLQLWVQAATDYRKATQLDGDQAEGYLGVAWMMATCPNARFRDQQQAVRAAKRALELAGGSDYRCLDTMAAALANAGQFEHAVKWQQQALQLAPKDLASPLQERLKLYEVGQPYREQAPAKTEP